MFIYVLIVRMSNSWAINLVKTWVLWCSGYHVCFTRRRPRVRTSPEPWFFSHYRKNIIDCIISHFKSVKKGVGFFEKTVVTHDLCKLHEFILIFLSLSGRETQVLWCSGYHVCFTRRRSRVRTSPEPGFSWVK